MPCDSQNQHLENTASFFNYVFPVITLILGAIIDRLFNYFVDRRKIITTGQQWLDEITYYIKPIEGQINHIRDFLNEHRKNEFSTPKFSLNASLKGDNFKSLEKASLYKYLVILSKDKHKSIELASKIHATIDVTSSNYNRLETIFNQYLENSSKEVAVFNDNLNKIMRAISSIGVELEKSNIDINSDPLYVELFHLQSEHIPESDLFNPELFSFRINFIIPMIHILAKYKTDDRTKGLADYLHLSSRAILKIKLEKDYLTEKMEKSIESLMYCKDRLLELKSQAYKS